MKADRTVDVLHVSLAFGHLLKIAALRCFNHGFLASTALVVMRGSCLLLPVKLTRIRTEAELHGHGGQPTQIGNVLLKVSPVGSGFSVSRIHESQRSRVGCSNETFLQLSLKHIERTFCAPRLHLWWSTQLVNNVENYAHRKYTVQRKNRTQNFHSFLFCSLSNSFSLADWSEPQNFGHVVNFWYTFSCK